MCRQWVATAKRNGVADAVGRRVTGHKNQTVYDGYERNAVGDDLRLATQAVEDAIERAG